MHFESLVNILCPILLCTLPVHSFFVQNCAEISIKDYILALFTVIGVVLLGIIGTNHFLNTILLSEIIFCFNFFAFLYANRMFIFIFSRKYRGVLYIQLSFILLYIAACSGISYLIILISKWLNLYTIVKIAFGISAFITFFIVSDIIKRIHYLYDSKNIETKELPPIETGDYPDIYHIITDCHTGFNREGYCDDYFREELIKQGFKISQHAKSNYNYTHCSMPSVLNMDYLENIVNPPVSEYLPSVTLKYYMNNKVFNILKQHGYSITCETFPGFKHLLNKVQPVNFSLICALLRSSLLSVLNINFELSTNNLEDVKNKLLKTASEEASQPKYFMGHILAPHRPYICKEDGTPNKKEDYSNVKYYFSYMKYIDKQLLKLIDELKAVMKKDSIILIHGDHSISGMRTNKFKVLLCGYFPQNFNSDCLPQDCTLVNLFRIIFNELFKTDYKLLENRFYSVSRFHGNTKMIENDNFGQLLIASNFDARLKELEQNYQDKRIVLYGAGSFLEYIIKHYDLSNLNIIALSDIRFDNSELVMDKEFAYNIISPDYINSLNPDIVLISTLEPSSVEKYFRNTLFKDKSKKFKYSYLFEFKEDDIM